MTKLITRLEAWLKEHRPAYYASLQPGATPEEIASLELMVGLSLPDLYKEMLAWRNGQADTSETFEGLYTYQSISSVISTIEVMRDLLETEPTATDEVWDSLWVPYLDDGSGNNVCLDLAGRFGGQSGQIIEYIHDDFVRPVMYPSFEAWLDTYVSAAEAGLLAMDGDYFMPTSEEIYHAYVREHNVGYPRDGVV
jgi:cell wall assembly regulator SMI1